MKRIAASLLLAFIFLFGAIAEEEDLFSIPAVEFPANAYANQSYAPPVDATTIHLNGNSAQIIGNGAELAESTVTIKQAGTYYLTGIFNGALIVDVREDKKVELLLNGVQLDAADESCLLVLTADKNVTVSLIEDSVNIFACTLSSETASQDGAHDAAIFSKADLKFEGNGSLYITCKGGKGINCRDDVTIRESTLYIQADDDGIRGKDSVTVNSGYLHITAGADGIRSTNTETEDKGIVSIVDGTILIDSKLDAIQTAGTLKIAGGYIKLKTADGAGEAEISGGRDMPPGGFGGGPGKMGRGDRNRGFTAAQEDTESTKGLKSDTLIDLSGGEIIIDAKDDAVHSNMNVTVNGSNLKIKAGDDGVHADQSLDMHSGNISILQSFEGVEAADLKISGGTVYVISSDDGINAAGGTTENTSYGAQGFRGFDGMRSASSGTLQISGGYTVIKGNGDGVDVNGNGTMTGGTLLIYGPTQSMNASLDYDQSFTVSGGMLLAAGSAGMAQSVSVADNANLLAFRCSIPANTLLHIQEKDGADVLTFDSPIPYSCVIFASDKLTKGAEYEIYAQGEHSGTSLDGIYLYGTYSSGTLLGTIPIH